MLEKNEDPLDRRWRRTETIFLVLCTLLALAVAAVLLGWIKPEGV